MTPKQKAMLDFIRGYITANDFSPSYDEIKAGVGLASKSGVHRTIEQLAAQGKIRRTAGRNRSLEVVGQQPSRTLAGHATALADSILAAIGSDNMIYEIGEEDLIAITPDELRAVIVQVLG